MGPIRSVDVQALQTMAKEDIRPIMRCDFDEAFHQVRLIDAEVTQCVTRKQVWAQLYNGTGCSEATSTSYLQLIYWVVTGARFGLVQGSRGVD